jgi:heptosyltransferase-2
MKLLIEPPTWLGDAIMASGAIDKIIEELNPTEVVIFGSFVSTELFKNHPKVTKIIVNKKKLIFNINADIGISFRRSLFSKIIFFLNSKKRYFFKNLKMHQVEKYNKFIDNILKKELKTYNPKIYFEPKKFENKTFGINPGATYGSAKRWYPKEFAQVANHLGKFGDVIIFGGPGEEIIANDIEKDLTITNYQNLAGKLTIKELCEYIGGLDGFITNDSGPMHIAAAYDIPIIAIFGPTDYTETSPWSDKYKIVTKNLDCAPCKKRECPLGTHECMKSITANDVIKEIDESSFFR